MSAHALHLSSGRDMRGRPLAVCRAFRRPPRRLAHLRSFMDVGGYYHLPEDTCRACVRWVTERGLDVVHPLRGGLGSDE